MNNSNCTNNTNYSLVFFILQILLSLIIRFYYIPKKFYPGPLLYYETFIRGVVYPSLSQYSSSSSSPSVILSEHKGPINC